MHEECAMKKFKRAMVFLILSVLAAGPLFAGVPNRIVYQGRLTKSGVSVSGAHTFRARLISAGGAEIWSSGDLALTLPPSGDFTLVLSPSGVNWINDDPKLEISVDGDILGPSDTFAASPYAIVASTAAMALAIADGAITNSSVGAAAGIAVSKLAPGNFPSGAYSFLGSDVSLGGSGVWNSGGNVGVGTTNPEVKLDVRGEARSQVSGMKYYMVPVGTILPYAGAAVPPGWLLCNGATVSRTTYADLYAALGNAWGSGDGVSTFHLPDLLGRFLRGRDGGVGRDPDRSSRGASAAGGNSGDNVGSIQGHAFTQHVHPHVWFAREITGEDPHIATGDPLPSYDPGTSRDTGGANPGAGNETRPINAYVNFIIKY
jgi:microcystin-dependent protein